MLTEMETRDEDLRTREESFITREQELSVKLEKMEQFQAMFGN